LAELRILGSLIDAWRRFRLRRSQPAPRAFRYERFGGIGQLGGLLGWPQALVFVDRQRAAALGHDTPPAGLWDGPEDGDLNVRLTAPLEAHLQLTNRCGAGCSGCYTGATPEGGRHEWGLVEWQRALDELAAAGVFHVALGGGESAELPWLGELITYARRIGIVPNLTTSGLYDDEVLARLAGWAGQGLFGQINVSIDGVEDDYARVRGFDGFARADRALVALRRVYPDVGINCVLTRPTFTKIDRLFAYAAKRRANEVELLRFKPSGRGARDDVYPQMRCTDEQHRSLLPTILTASRRHRMRVRLDCSFTPMVVHHRPPVELVRFLCVYGCAAGDLLVAARASGQLSACSFYPPTNAKVDGLRAYSAEKAAFSTFRSYFASPPAPCDSCDYRSLCRGGCRAVAVHVAGDARQPDPECPRVIDLAAARSKVHLPVLG
jgi:radical SAM protein with 4Fe4S-binding SPASM domain